jgi:hypothetical protein
MNSQIHSFHIPVLGLGFSIDAPAKVARYGISSVMSIVDDKLMEHLRKNYLEKAGQNYVCIDEKENDCRARRITAYLNMINQTVKEQFEKLKSSAFEIGSEITKYFEMLPDVSVLKIKYNEMLSAKEQSVKEKLQNWLRENIKPGSVDVNIMTKLDKANYDSDGNLLPVEFNDAMAALRGYASSELESSIVFSAGMNPRLYSYIEKFEDFFPSAMGKFKKKIIIKVSDFRSALIQGKFLAKKGLWVSEYRIESSLNCGGHAFATDGLLLGPILEEFKKRKGELLTSIKEIYLPALKKKEITIDEEKLSFDVTVQGGVGNSSEQEFLQRYYGVQSVGWGSPFLLVPEVMNIDEPTLQQLCNAGENDLYLSDISPLGVPFNSLRGNSKDAEKYCKIENGKPGSACTKKYLESNKEFSERSICTASITYLKKKIADLKNNYSNPTDYQNAFNVAVQKACLCEGLASSALIVNNIETPKTSQAVSVCPGPNLAYFSKVATLKEMIDHIYGRINLVTDSNRPHMFVKELKVYIDFLQKKMENRLDNISVQSEEFFNTFQHNLMDGIEYYKTLIPEISEASESVKQKIREEFETLEQKLASFTLVSAV